MSLLFLEQDTLASVISQSVFFYHKPFYRLGAPPLASISAESPPHISYYYESSEQSEAFVTAWNFVHIWHEHPMVEGSKRKKWLSFYLHLKAPNYGPTSSRNVLQKISAVFDGFLCPAYISENQLKSL